MRALVLIALSMVTISSGATGCEYISPTARLPGFSDDQAAQRALALRTDWGVIGLHNYTEALRKEATSIYLARVIRSQDEADNFTTTTAVLPLKQIKGKIPKGERILKGYLRDSCDGANGDGDGAYAKVAELVIVFEGVAKKSNRPNGIDSVTVARLRNVDLLDAVQSWLDEQPGYVAYD